MIPSPCIEVQTSPLDRPSVPPWFAEVVIIARYLATKGLLEAFARAPSAWCEVVSAADLPIDFLALLIGYAISGERTLADFFERLAPFQTAFMALDAAPRSSPSLQFESLSGRCRSSLFGSVPHARASSRPSRDAWTAESLGGIFDRQGRRYLVFDVDATRQAARRRQDGRLCARLSRAQAW
jgi:hypothetical protein